MKKVWRQLAVIIFVCTMVTLIVMQAYLTKRHKSENMALRSAMVKANWQYDAEGQDSDFEFIQDYGPYESDKYNQNFIKQIQEGKRNYGASVSSSKGSDVELEAASSETLSTDLETEGTEINMDVEVTQDWGVRKEDLVTESPTDEEAEEEDVNVQDDAVTDYSSLSEITEAMNPDASNDNTPASEMCPEYSSELVGVLTVNASFVPTEEEAIAIAGDMLVDGCFEPTACIPRQTVAVIIPYKNRKQHLITLMHHLHPILKRQSIRYCVFVAEQFDNGSFNKARVMNAVFQEITKNQTFTFECVIFHDVDMMLEDDRNMHICGKMPKHLSPAIDKFNYTSNYGTKFGGVTAISVEHYRKVNGHSNNFWGWGGEDNDMEVRIAHSNLTIMSTNKTYGRYKMIPHDHPWYFSPLYGVGSYLQSKKHWSVKEVDNSGLSDLHYKVRFITKHKLWTRITIDIRTLLVEKAVVRFQGQDIGELAFISPSYSTEYRLTSQQEFSTEDPGKRCTYERFTGKTVNKTLGVRDRLTYGRMYKSLEEAQKMCDELRTYCGSIVEEHPGKFSMRAAGYMHENYLKYRMGMVRQVGVIEQHHTHSVHVKICPEDSGYLNFFKKPFVMEGDAKLGPSPAYYVEFKIRVFYEVNQTLYYDSDITTAHKAIMQEKVDAHITESSTWDTLGNVYSNRIKLLNMSEPRNFANALPAGFKNLQQLLTEGDGIITVKTPLNGILRHPGCYVCRSTLVDDTGAALLQWKWWFEIRAKTKEIEEEILNRQLERAKLTSVEFTDTVEKRREMWLKYHNKVKAQHFVGNVGMPSNIQDFVEKNSFPKRT